MFGVWGLGFKDLLVLSVGEWPKSDDAGSAKVLVSSFLFLVGEWPKSDDAGSAKVLVSSFLFLVGEWPKSDDAGAFTSIESIEGVMYQGWWCV